jgi:hypothetical protein
VRKPTAPTNTTATAATTTTPSRKSSTFEDLEHSWAPKGYTPGASDKTYADLAAAKEEAETRKREREARAALEAREAEIERRERALKNKETDRARAEEARRKAAEAEALRKKEAELARREKALKAKQPKRPPFDFAKEKPQILVAIANASQAANNLVNACRVGWSGVGDSRSQRVYLTDQLRRSTLTERRRTLPRTSRCSSISKRQRPRGDRSFDTSR